MAELTDEQIHAKRMERLTEVNSGPSEREKLEALYEQVWDTEEMSREFTLEVFAAPYVVCTRKSDGARGTLEFKHLPRFYFNFVAA